MNSDTSELTRESEFINKDTVGQRELGILPKTPRKQLSELS